MKLNIFGELQIDAYDYAEYIVKEFEKSSFIKISPKMETLKGFEQDSHISLYVPGFYCIYHEKKPVYVGHSNYTVYNRISRFLSGVRGTEMWGEKHYGAYKFKRLFKDDMSNLSVKLCKKPNTHGTHINDTDIEIALIRILKPFCNNEIYKNNFVSDVRIHL